MAVSGVVLVVVPVHSVAATGCTFGGSPPTIRRSGLRWLCSARHRTDRLGHSAHVPGLHLGRITRPRMANSRFPWAISSSSLRFQVSSPRRRRTRDRDRSASFTRYGDQDPKFWIRPTCTLWNARRSSCPGSCILRYHQATVRSRVAQVGRRVAPYQPPRSMAPSVGEIGMDEITWSQGYS